MTTMDDTQTIDADALRARLAEMAQRARDEMTPAGLRERIAAALRARHGDGVTVEFFARGNAVARVRYSVSGLHCVTSVFCHDENDGGALGALAYACGLNVDGTDPREQGEALARRLHAERESVVAELDRARDETDYLDALLARQHAILTGVANALRGDPGPLASHSHHDLAERAAAAVAEVARLRALLEVAQTSLAAATSGRRVTACDEIERLQRERDALRDAAREYLEARHNALVALDAYLDADPADAAARDAASADEARVTATRTRLAALVGGAP